MRLPFPRKKWTKNEWDQLKGLTKIEVIKILDKDDTWEYIGTKGGRYIYKSDEYDEPFNHLAVHYHHEGYGDKMLRDVLRL